MDVKQTICGTAAFALFIMCYGFADKQPLISLMCAAGMALCAWVGELGETKGECHVEREKDS